MPARNTPGEIDGSSEELPRLVNLALGQYELLERIANGAPLQDTLSALLLFVERDVPGMVGSVLLVDEDGAHLRHGTSPSLPDAYWRVMDGAPIGPQAGSCGTAAFLKEPVVTVDTGVDPLWAEYRGLARLHGLRACWSTPILRGSKVIGTFAMYFREPRRPDGAHHQLMTIATHIAAIAIGKHIRETVIRDSEERYRLINLATNDAVWDWDVRKNTLWWNDGVERLFGYPASEMTSDLGWWADRVHPDDRARVQHSLHEAAETGAASWREEYRFLRREGTYADVQDRGYVMRNDAGATVRMIGMMQDISERRQAQREIDAQRLKVLKATMRTVQDIVGNFLNNVQLFQIEAEGKLPPESLAELEALARETAGRLTALGNLEEVQEVPLAIGSVIRYDMGQGRPTS